jgi:AcrR family transcriptional regulator
MKSTKRIRREREVARAQILDAAKQIMLDEGYAAVGSRRVAEVAGVSVTLVYYYFPTTDDLFIALYRHVTEAEPSNLERALASADPLAALWQDQTDPARAALGVEFLALANHRKVIRSEIIRHAEATRACQAQALAGLLDGLEIVGAPCPPVCVATLITSVARTLIMEDGVGIALGHDETRALVDRVLAQLQVTTARA